jgi:hypothetical protein
MTCKKNGQSQDFKTHFLICPNWTTARKTKEKVFGDHNRPLGLILEWKVVVVVFFVFLLLLHYFAKSDLLVSFPALY